MARLEVYTKKRAGETVEDQLNKQAARIVKIRKADAAKKARGTWVSRLKKGVKKILKGRHSIAGKRYLAESKKGTTVKQMYKSIKQDNPKLSDKDALRVAKDAIGRITQEKGFRRGRK